MTSRKLVVLLTLSAVGGLAATAAAGTVTQVRNLNLPAAVVVNGVRLEPGDYTLIWDLNHSRTSVAFATGERRLATIPARLVREKKQFVENTIICAKEADGACALEEIHFAGSRQAIAFHITRARRPAGPNPSFTVDMMMTPLETPSQQPAAAIRQPILP